MAAGSPPRRRTHNTVSIRNAVHVIRLKCSAPEHSWRGVRKYSEILRQPASLTPVESRRTTLPHNRLQLFTRFNIAATSDHWSPPILEHNPRDETAVRFVEQLNTLDAGFLMAEDSDRNVSLAIGGVAIIEGAVPDFEKFKSVLAERIQAIPRCRQMLRTQPFDIGAPQWVDDPGFDLSRHVRRAAVPRPGDDTELFGVVADVLERRLDRDRPLWECWVIEGLKGNQWAMLMKIHHCMADGISAIRILTRLCDDIDGDVFAAPVVTKGTAAQKHLKPVPDPKPRSNPLGDLWRTATGITDAAARTVSGAAEIATGLLRPTAGSSLVGPVSAMRRYRAVRVPLADVEQICRKFDVTINDVALTAITEGFRSVLFHRGEEPRPDSL